LLLESFARFYSGVFPSIDPGAREALRKAIRQHGEISADFFASQPPPQIVQGDVVGPLTFFIETSDGSLLERKVPGMLLSQSCDFDQDQWVLFAPAFPYKDFADGSNASSIRANQITTMFYLPAVVHEEAVVIDFRLTQPFAKKLIAEKLTSGTIRRNRSFTDEGWYLLLAKLTLHFLRPQPTDEVRGVSLPSLRERVVYLMWQIPALGRYLVEGRG
jgi:hypothetical protein